ncbi:hypothetical protein EVAR_103177_1 [Eumeta japonica]|uniref:Uncharacterized protein n=1 Tax=Eumeta variegata TaxID=151549 RepID=A0A4C1YHA2_EUMVA|nr:hypothetical protein EVAR_103177_1 [Eumeta japonica]
MASGMECERVRGRETVDGHQPNERIRCMSTRAEPRAKRARTGTEIKNETGIETEPWIRISIKSLTRI